MRALITGATGFTGSALCARLVRDGWSVRAFVRSSARVEPLRKLGVECIDVDITDRAQVLREYRPVDRIFNIAAMYRAESPDRDEFRRVNVEALRNMLEAARTAGVGRFVHCSTVGIHGHIDEAPADEEYRPQPNDHYQESKWEGEKLARQYFAEGLPGTVIRPAAIYGPGDLRFLKLFKAIKSGLFVMVGSGKTFYHLVYIDDLVQGFMLASEQEGALGESFIIAGPEYSTVTELSNQVADAIGCPHPWLKVPHWPVHVAAVACEKICQPFGIQPPLYPRRVEFFVMSRAFRTDKARRLLGYVPQVGAPEGLARTAAWYRSQGLI